MRPLRLLLLTALAPGLLAVPALAGSSSAEEPVAVAPQVQELDVRGVDATAAAGSSPPGVTGALVEGDGRRTVLLTGQLPTEPYAVVGVTWDADPAVTAVEAFVRTRTAGTWSPWRPVGGRSDEEPDAGTPDTGAALRGGTSPLWVDGADGVQVRVDVLSGADPRGLRVSLVDPGESQQDLSVSASLSTQATSAPVVLTRAQWGADESIRRGSPSYASGIHAVTVHHTASSNDYSAADVPRLIRGFYAYHVKSNGWSDLGYNFLVDRFGRIWEGRGGRDHQARDRLARRRFQHRHRRHLDDRDVRDGGPVRRDARGRRCRRRLAPRPGRAGPEGHRRRPLGRQHAGTPRAPS